MKYILFLLSIVVLLLCVNCSGEVTPPLTPNPEYTPEDSACANLPAIGPFEFTFISSDSVPNDKYPCFNPNNPMEFVYYNKYRELYKYNAQTKQNTLIYSWKLSPSYVYIREPIQWGRNDWLLFSMSDNNGINVGIDIYKIKSNGDSLTCLTSAGTNPHSNPLWSPDASLYIYENNHKDIKYICKTATNEVIDSIPNSLAPFHFDSWSETNKICGVSFEKIYVYDFNTKTYQVVHQHAFDITSWNPMWLKDNQTICKISQGNIVAFNTQSHTSKLLRKGCQTIEYINGSYSPLTRKMLWTKIKRKYIGNFKVFYSTHIVIMNEDGSEETEIDLE